MKILIVTTVSSTIKAFLMPHIKLLKKMGFNVDIASFCLENDKEYLENYVDNVFNISFTRSIKSIKNIQAYKEIKNILVQNNYNLIYTHTPIASAITRFANNKSIKTKVIYFAHGFHFYKGASKLSWFIYYPLEKYLAKSTNAIITINDEDFKRAHLMGFNKVYKINGAGLNISNVNHTSIDKNIKKKEFDIPISSKIILSVGELNKNKNHSAIIKALSMIPDKNIYYIIAGEGPEKNNLLKLAQKVKFNNLRLIGYRSDMNEIYMLADIFCFPSYREGLPFSLMEAMVSGIPCIASDIRGNNDLIKNEKNGLLINPYDYLSFSNNIKRILLDNKLRDRIVNSALNDVKNYSIESVLKQLFEIFNSYL